MQNRKSADDGVNHVAAEALLRNLWETVTNDAGQHEHSYVKYPALCDAIRSSINHTMVSFRFCLPTQLLGKAVNPAIDCLSMQRRTEPGYPTSGWDARSLARKVVAVFNATIENVLGPSSDPYVGNPMRIPRNFAMIHQRRIHPGGTESWTFLKRLRESTILSTPAISYFKSCSKSIEGYKTSDSSIQSLLEPAWKPCCYYVKSF
jgi:hypothetical protein